VFIGGGTFSGPSIEARSDADREQLQVDMNADGVFGLGNLEINGLPPVAAGHLIFV
jgi:hypothetical protein